MTVVGLGGGTLPKYLSAMLTRQRTGGHVDSVEISHNVYRVARDYFLFHGLNNSKTYIMDGADYFYDKPNTLDWVFLDAFDQLEGPVAFLFNKQFAKSVYRSLVPGGICTINAYETTPQDLTVYRDLFGRKQSGILTVSDDQQILVFVKRPAKLSRKLLTTGIQKFRNRFPGVDLQPFAFSFRRFPKNIYKK
jgi:hypothetical protein